MRRYKEDWDHSELVDQFFSLIEESLCDLRFLCSGVICETDKESIAIIEKELSKKIAECVDKFSHDDIAWLTKECGRFIADFFVSQTQKGCVKSLEVSAKFLKELVDALTEKLKNGNSEYIE